MFTVQIRSSRLGIWGRSFKFIGSFEEGKGLEEKIKRDLRELSRNKDYRDGFIDGELFEYALVNDRGFRIWKIRFRKPL